MAASVAYRAVLDIRRDTVVFLSTLLHAERRTRGTHTGTRAIGCFTHAILVLRWFLDGTRIAQLARDNTIATSTAYRYLHEGIAVLAARKPSLHAALLAAKIAGHTHINLDGTLIHTDRCKIPGPTAGVDLYWSGKHPAPRGALSYTWLSQEELEEMFLGLMPYLAPKGQGDSSMAGNQRSCPGVWNDALGDPRDTAKAGLLTPQSPAAKSPALTGKTPETGAVALRRRLVLDDASSGERAMPSEGIQGDEWGAYVALGRMTGTNVGSSTGREPYGDGGLVVVVGVTPHQGVRESRTQGEGEQVVGTLQTRRYA